MTSFIGKPENLALSGPRVAVKLWVPQQVKSTIPPIDTLAEIDTAITTTYIQEGIATSLGLEPIKTTTIMTVTNPKRELYVFRIRVVFPEGKVMFEVDAIEVPYMMRHGARIKCLIGRDILRYGVLTYNGLLNTFSLNFTVTDMWMTG